MPTDIEDAITARLPLAMKRAERKVRAASRALRLATSSRQHSVRQRLRK